MDVPILQSDSHTSCLKRTTGQRFCCNTSGNISLVLVLFCLFLNAGMQDHTHTQKLSYVNHLNEEKAFKLVIKMTTYFAPRCGYQGQYAHGCLPLKTQMTKHQTKCDLFRNKTQHNTCNE